MKSIECALDLTQSLAYIMKFLIVCAAIASFSSCAQNKYEDIQTTGLQHSS